MEAIELRNRKTPLICTIVITFILLVSLSEAPLFQDSSLTNAPSGAKVLADLKPQELMPDPNFTSPPEVVVVGESGEFSHRYESVGEDGRAVLIWNHTAGTHLDFPVVPNIPYVACDDFIYLTQPLPWESNTTPYRVRVTMEYGFEVTGTFQTNRSGWSMFRARVWLITPDYWVPIGGSIPRINGTPQSYPIDLQESTIEYAWYNLETPSDQMSIAIEFSPSYQFNEFFDGSEPWRNYTGVVSMTVEGVSVEALSGRPTPVDEMEPLYVGYLPSNASGYCVDIEDANDGTMYTLSLDYGSGLYRTTLVRWSESANVIWSSSTNMSSSIIGKAIGVYGANVYAIGRHETSSGDYRTMLLGWSSDGTLTFAKDLNFKILREPDLEIANDGSIYIVGYRSVLMPSYWIQEYLLKIDQEGTVIWERPFSRSSYGFASLEVSNEGDIYAMSEFSLTKWDQDGNMLWNNTGWFLDLDLSPNGTIYCMEATYDKSYYYYWYFHIFLIGRDSDGQVLWNHSVDTRFTATWTEPIYPYSMEVAADGSLYSLFEIYRGEQRFRLAKYDTSGTQLWNRSLAPLSNESGYWFDGKMVPCRNGLIYIIGRHYDIESEVFSLRMLAYLDSGYPVDPFSLPETRLVIAFAAIAVLVVGDVTRRRRGLQFRV